MSRRAWDQMVERSEMMRVFRVTMFKRIVPNLKAIGLLSERIRYFAGAHNVSGRIRAGTFLTPALAPGQSVRLRVRVTRAHAAKPHDVRTVQLTGTSIDDPVKRDAVATIVRATR